MRSQGELGNLGEPAVSLQRVPEEEGYRLTKSPGANGRLPPVSESATEHKGGSSRVSRSEPLAKRPERGSLAVLAEHSTEGRGEDALAEKVGN